MTNALRFITGVLRDPPPGYAFELSPGHVAVARAGRDKVVEVHELAADILAVSPLRDNVLRPEALAAAIREAAPANGGRKRRTAALVLPDYAVRVAVLDFDAFPSDSREQLSLIRFRLKKSLPFDVDSAAVSYHAQPSQDGGKRVDVAVAAAPLDVVAHYEAPFRACGFHVGLVTTSTLAALQMVPAGGIKLLIKRSGGALSLAVAQSRALKLVRSIELGDPSSFQEVLGHLYPTVAYIEDQLGGRPDAMLLCGFGALAEEAGAGFSAELGVPAALLNSRFGAPGEFSAGLVGYLESLEGF